MCCSSGGVKMFSISHSHNSKFPEPDLSTEVWIDGIATPISHCLNANVGEIGLELLNKLDFHNFDQVLVTAEKHAIGIIDTSDLKYLYEHKKNLSIKSKFIKQVYVYVKTSLEDVLKIFENTNSAILLNGAKTDVNSYATGLITLSDLNKSAFRGLLYQLFANLEGNLSKIIDQTYENHWDWLPWLSENHQISLIGSWEISKRNKVDLRPINGANLTQILTIIGKSQELRKIMGFESRNKYDDLTGRIPEIRNKIMHPVRPLVLNSDDVSQLRKCLETISDLQKRSTRILDIGK